MKKYIAIGKYQIERKRGIFILSFLMLSLFLIILSLCINNQNMWQPVLQSFGIELMAGIGLFVLLDNEFHKIMSEKGENISIKIPEDLHEIIDDIRINKFIRILTTFFSFIEDHTKIREFEDKLINVVKQKKANVQILILDPISYATTQRFSNMKNVENQNNGQITQYPTIEKTFYTLKKLYEIDKFLKTNHDIKFEVRIFDLLPPYLLYQVDKSYNMAFYGKDIVAVNADFWRFSNESEFADFVTNQFEKIWSSQSCSLDDFMFLIFEKKLTEKKPFIDIYDSGTGVFFENKIVGFESDTTLDSNQKVYYRGSLWKFEIINVTLSNRKGSFLIVAGSNDSIKFSNNKNTFEDYQKYLWELKYNTNNSGSNRHFPTPKNIMFIQLFKDN